jgi:hypothetical protein
MKLISLTHFVLGLVTALGVNPGAFAQSNQFEASLQRQKRAQLRGELAKEVLKTDAVVKARAQNLPQLKEALARGERVVLVLDYTMIPENEYRFLKFEPLETVLSSPEASQDKKTERVFTVQDTYRFGDFVQSSEVREEVRQTKLSCQEQSKKDLAEALVSDPELLKLAQDEAALKSKFEVDQAQAKADFEAAQIEKVRQDAEARTKAFEQMKRDLESQSKEVLQGFEEAKRIIELVITTHACPTSAADMKVLVKLASALYAKKLHQKTDLNRIASATKPALGCAYNASYDEWFDLVLKPGIGKDWVVPAVTRSSGSESKLDLTYLKSEPGIYLSRSENNKSYRDAKKGTSGITGDNGDVVMFELAPGVVLEGIAWTKSPMFAKEGFYSAGFYFSEQLMKPNSSKLDTELAQYQRPNLINPYPELIQKRQEALRKHYETACPDQKTQ